MAGPYPWVSHDSGIELTAHYETEPAEHPDAHIRLHGLDVDRGMATVKAILDDADISYDRLEPHERPRIPEESLESVRRS